MRFTLKTAGFAVPLLLTLALASCTTPPPGPTVPPTGALAVEAGGYHTCALLANGTVTCWGHNAYGQLGNPTNDTPNPTPTPVPDLTGVTQITVGDRHTCALLHNGTVTCWGFNFWGQLGNPTNSGNFNPNPTPTPVADLTGVTRITAGNDYTCAVLTGGTVTCWGNNRFGQLGNPTNIGTNTPNPTPTPLTDLTGVTQLAAGDFHTCAVLTGATATCWGNNYFGQLGNPTNIGIATPNPTPTPVADLTGVTRISAGDQFTCAVLSGRTATCWGRNNYGQLGNPTNSGTNTPNSTPTPVADLTGVKRISASYQHACASLTNGTLTCWGSNLYGQLGNPTNIGTNTPTPTPTAVAGPTGATQLAAGWRHTCAALNNGTLTCWGNNFWGQLGNPTNTGTNTLSPTPTAVTGIP